jgi:YD repeat-containing protein
MKTPSKTVNGVTTNYTYNDFNQLVSESGADTASYAYDANGNLTSRTNGANLENFIYDGEEGGFKSSKSF